MDIGWWITFSKGVKGGGRKKAQKGEGGHYTCREISRTRTPSHTLGMSFSPTSAKMQHVHGDYWGWVKIFQRSCKEVE